MPRTDNPMPQAGMVLAAGRGERMRPLTAETPKALIAVNGRTLVDRAIDQLEAVGVGRIVVNAHYLADKLEAHLAARNDSAIVVSREAALMDTGGGVKQALDLLAADSFFVVNCDGVWTEGPNVALRRMARLWDDARMDALLLLLPMSGLQRDIDSVGDFIMAPDGRLRRRRENAIAPFLFVGVQLLHRRAFADAPDGPFSLNKVYDRAQEAGRLYGLVHDGEWFHVGTLEGLKTAERGLAAGMVSVNRR
jgi:MurNAc alpha-1-phosphate uridylyltransferase